MTARPGYDPNAGDFVVWDETERATGPDDDRPAMRSYLRKADGSGWNTASGGRNGVLHFDTFEEADAVRTAVVPSYRRSGVCRSSKVDWGTIKDEEASDA